LIGIGLKILRIVMKFGGTSVADIGRLEHVALRVRRQVDAGDQVAVVVSAMAGVTNQLVGYAKALGAVDSLPEYDAVVSTGEQITTALLALALQQIGVSAQSFMGWQVPIQTDDCHGQAHIRSIDPQVFESCWEKGIVPIVAGFQGITPQGRLTTLGRGGSDTTAVAIAAAVHADRCDIYTDVDGVYTADPRVVPLARKLAEISYGEMLELAAQGAKVLHPRSVGTALLATIPVQVLSSFEDKPGTRVVDSTTLSLTGISGITHSTGWLKLTLTFKGGSSLQNRILKTLLTTAAIPHEVAVLSLDQGDTMDVFLPHGYLTPVLLLLEEHKIVSDKEVAVLSDLAKVTLVGRGLIAKNGWSQRLLSFLKPLDFSTHLVTLTGQKLSIGVHESQACSLVRQLHNHFNLDQHYGDSPQTLAAGL
jgi:aspartate kinase